jgi:hypothetical protein
MLVEVSPGVWEERSARGSVDGGLFVVTSPASVWAYGPYPQYAYQPFNFSSAIAAVGLIPGVTSYHRGVFTISGLASETIAVTLGYEAGNDSDGILVRNSAGTLVQAAALGNGTYYIDPDIAGDELIFTKSGAVDAASIRGHLVP